MPADQGLVDSVANENLKVGAGGPAFYGNAQMNTFATQGQDAAAHRARLQIIAEQELQLGLSFNRAVASKAINALFVLDTQEEALGGAVLGQQGAKVAQTTPPVTP